MFMNLSVCIGPQTVTVTITVTEPVYLKLEIGNIDQYDRDIHRLQQQVADLQRQLADYKSELQKSGGSLHAMKQELLLSHTSRALEHQKTRHPEFKLEAVSNREAMLSTLSRDSSGVVLSDDMARVSKPEASSAGAPTADQHDLAVASTAAAGEDGVVLAESSSTLVSPRPTGTSDNEIPVHPRLLPLLAKTHYVSCKVWVAS